jgi:hypothetical protein
MADVTLALLAEVRAYLAQAKLDVAAKLARYTKATITDVTASFTDVAAGDNVIATKSVAEGEALVLPIIEVGKKSGDISKDKIQIVDETGASRAVINLVSNGERIGENAIKRLDIVLEPVHTYTIKYVAAAAITGANLTVSLQGFRVTTV